MLARCVLERNNGDLLPIDSSGGDEGVLILKQNHRDTLLGVLQERQGVFKDQPSSLRGKTFMKEGQAVEGTHNTGSHATSAAPPLLWFGGGVRLRLVVSTADLFHLPVETIWEGNMITMANAFKFKMP